MSAVLAWVWAFVSFERVCSQAQGVTRNDLMRMSGLARPGSCVVRGPWMLTTAVNPKWLQLDSARDELGIDLDEMANPMQVWLEVFVRVHGWNLGWGLRERMRRAGARGRAGAS